MVTGCLQGTLLAMSIYFELQARDTQKAHVENTDDQILNGHAVAGDSEETPLLRPSD